MKNGPLKLGNSLLIQGCFTFEPWIRGKNEHELQIALGLPERRVGEGVYILYAVFFPGMRQFHLAGNATVPVDKFYDHKTSIWYQEKWLKTTVSKEHKPGDVNIEQIKKAWLLNMAHHKLVKVIQVIRRNDEDKFPNGHEVPQIIVTGDILCRVAAFVKGEDVFSGIDNFPHPSLPVLG